MKRRAVLIIHGFAGGTYDQEEVAHCLQLSGDFDVFSFTLPGHDGRRKEATRKNWLEESERQLNKLIESGYSRICLVGHSMGGVIASYLASKYKSVTRLVLLAPAFKYFSYEGGLLDKIKQSKQLFQAYDKDSRLTFMTKLPLSAFQEFVKLVAENQDTLERIKVPTLIIQGKTDKVVPPQTGEYIFEKIKTDKKILINVNYVGHEMFKNNRSEEICEIISKFIKRFGFMIEKETKEI